MKGIKKLLHILFTFVIFIIAKANKKQYNGDSNSLGTGATEPMKIYANSDRFVRARIRKGYTQKELAELAGISHSYISLLERSVKSVGPKVAVRLCQLLDSELDELFVIAS
jgi:putative transcriptional regulator